MAKIAAQLMSNARSDDDELVFAVFHVFQMLTSLKADYQARWHGEKRAHHEAPAPIDEKAQPAAVGEPRQTTETINLSGRLASCRAAFLLGT
jgi:hypothetical protein